MKKYVVGCFQDVVGKKRLLVKFESGKKKDMISVSIQYVCQKEEVCLEIDQPISGIPQKEIGKLLTIDGGPVVEEASMSERGVYFSVFYCLCYVEDISTDMLEGQFLEERYLDQNQ